MGGPKGEECRKCYFAEDSNPDAPDHEYWCRRYPPQVPYRAMPSDPDPGRYDPWEITCVFGGCWCGEFKPRDA